MTEASAGRRDECLTHQDSVTADIASTAGALDAAGWSTATNCPPWDVTMLIAHMTRGAESFIATVSNAAQGVTAEAQSPEERQRRQSELAALPADELLETFKKNQAAFRALLAGLSAEDLDKEAQHPWAVQPLWWFADQRLAELAFHAWDLHHSLGTDQEIPAAVAQFLMPSILERNVAAFHKPSPPSYGKFLIEATDVENGSWIVEPGEVGVTMTRSSGEADVTISGPAAALIRWFYGRAEIAELMSSGQVSVTGMEFRVKSWHDIFPAR